MKDKKTFLVLCKDGVPIEIPDYVYNKSEPLLNVIKTLSMNDSLQKNKDGYPLNNIQSNTLKKVIKYFDFHQNDEIKIKEALVADDQEFNNLFMQYNGAPSTSKYVPRQYINDVKKAIEIFDLQFCKSTSLLFNIFECGNILKFNEIVEFAAEHLGNRLQERKPSEIRKALDLTNDWDEEEYICSNRNAWNT